MHLPLTPPRSHSGLDAPPAALRVVFSPTAHLLRHLRPSLALSVSSVSQKAGNARLSFRRALGELYESQAALQLGAAWGYVPAEQAQASVEALDALGARLYGLSQR